MRDRAGEELAATFRSVGEEFGYDDMDAEFTAFRDLKMRWTRSYKWIRFEVSDYLKGAPAPVLESVARTVFRKIDGSKDEGYSEDASRWMTSEDFVRRNQPVYVRRNRGLSMSTEGRCRDLADSYERLVAAGYVERDPLIYLGWGIPTSRRVSGFSSVLMRVVVISQLLDDESVPEEVLDYCVYAQLAHISMGFDPHFRKRSDEYDGLLERFEGRSEAERTLEKLSIML